MNEETDECWLESTAVVLKFSIGSSSLPISVSTSLIWLCCPTTVHGGDVLSVGMNGCDGGGSIYSRPGSSKTSGVSLNMRGS